jgi:hypothetical protein
VQNVVVNVHFRHLGLHSFASLLLHGFLVLLLLVRFSDARNTGGGNKLGQGEGCLFNATLALQIPVESSVNAIDCQSRCASSLALVAPVTRHGHSVTRALQNVRHVFRTRGYKQHTFEMNEQTRVLRRHVPSLHNFGLLHQLLQLGDAATKSERARSNRSNHRVLYLNRLMSFLRRLLRLFSSGADGGNGTLLALASILSTASGSSDCSSSLGKKCSKTPFQCS